MKRVSLVAVLIALPLGLAACAQQKEARWVKEDATENQLRSDLYWCTKVKREAFHRHNDPKAAEGRRSYKYIDAQCMRERGWRREPGN